EALLAHRAGRVPAAEVEALAELADAERHDDVATRPVERDDDPARRLLAPLLDERELLEIHHVGSVRYPRGRTCRVLRRRRHAGGALGAAREAPRAAPRGAVP